jgi:outer membrane immunogenic protein
MKRISLAGIALGVAALGTPALGADLPMYSKAPPAVAPVYDWTGVYIGGFGGYSFGNHNLNNALGPAGNANFTTNWESHGPLGGGEIGYNWQSGNIIFGVEADGAGTNVQGNDNFALGSNDANKLKWVASLRARGGVAVDRLLLFFTGGWATGDIVHTNTDPVLGVDQFTSHRSGLAAGGGLAYAMTDNIIGKFEYRYYDLGRYSRAGSPLTPNGQLPFTVDSTYSVVTLGLDFKFGWPVVAKY